MTQVRRLVQLVLLAFVIACHRGTAPAPVVVPQPPDEKEPVRVARTMVPMSSSKVPAGQLVGIVVDDSTGERVSFPQVFLATAIGGTPK